MKKLKWTILILLITTTIISCSNNGGMKLKTDKLTERENRILTLSGNKMAMYTIDNLPEKPITVEVSYDYYKGTELIENKILGGISVLDPLPKKEKIEVGVNIFDNREISTVIRMGAGSTSSRTDISDKDFLKSHISGFLEDDIPLALGSEVYILQASKGDFFVSLGLGQVVDKDILKSVLERQDETFLIKLSIKETERN